MPTCSVCRREDLLDDAFSAAQVDKHPICNDCAAAATASLSDTVGGSSAEVVPPLESSEGGEKKEDEAVIPSAAEVIESPSVENSSLPDTNAVIRTDDSPLGTTTANREVDESSPDATGSPSVVGETEKEEGEQLSTETRSKAPTETSGDVPQSLDAPLEDAAEQQGREQTTSDPVGDADQSSKPIVQPEAPVEEVKKEEDSRTQTSVPQVASPSGSNHGPMQMFQLFSRRLLSPRSDPKPETPKVDLELEKKRQMEKLREQLQQMDAGLVETLDAEQKIQATLVEKARLESQEHGLPPTEGLEANTANKDAVPETDSIPEVTQQATLEPDPSSSPETKDAATNEEDAVGEVSTSEGHPESSDVVPDSLEQALESTPTTTEPETLTENNDTNKNSEATNDLSTGEQEPALSDEIPAKKVDLPIDSATSITEREPNTSEDTMDTTQEGLDIPVAISTRDEALPESDGTTEIVDTNNEIANEPSPSEETSLISHEIPVDTVDATIGSVVTNIEPDVSADAVGTTNDSLETPGSLSHEEQPDSAEATDKTDNVDSKENSETANDLPTGEEESPQSDEIPERVELASDSAELKAEPGPETLAIAVDINEESLEIAGANEDEKSNLADVADTTEENVANETTETTNEIPRGEEEPSKTDKILAEKVDLTSESPTSSTEPEPEPSANVVDIEKERQEVLTESVLSTKEDEVSNSAVAAVTNDEIVTNENSDTTNELASGEEVPPQSDDISAENADFTIEIPAKSLGQEPEQDIPADVVDAEKESLEIPTVVKKEDNESIDELASGEEVPPQPDDIPTENADLTSESPAKSSEPEQDTPADVADTDKESLEIPTGSVLSTEDHPKSTDATDTTEDIVTNEHDATTDALSTGDEVPAQPDDIPAEKVDLPSESAITSTETQPQPEEDTDKESVEIPGVLSMQENELPNSADVAATTDNVEKNENVETSNELSTGVEMPPQSDETPAEKVDSSSESPTESAKPNLEPSADVVDTDKESLESPTSSVLATEPNSTDAGATTDYVDIEAANELSTRVKDSPQLDEIAEKADSKSAIAKTNREAEIPADAIDTQEPLEIIDPRSNMEGNVSIPAETTDTPTSENLADEPLSKATFTNEIPTVERAASEESPAPARVLADKVSETLDCVLTAEQLPSSTFEASRNEVVTGELSSSGEDQSTANAIIATTTDEIVASINELPHDQSDERVTTDEVIVNESLDKGALRVADVETTSEGPSMYDAASPLLEGDQPLTNHEQIEEVSASEGPVPMTEPLECDNGRDLLEKAVHDTGTQAHPDVASNTTEIDEKDAEESYTSKVEVQGVPAGERIGAMLAHSQPIEALKKLSDLVLPSPVPRRQSIETEKRRQSVLIREKLHELNLEELEMEIEQQQQAQTQLVQQAMESSMSRLVHDNDDKEDGSEKELKTSLHNRSSRVLGQVTDWLSSSLHRNDDVVKSPSASRGRKIDVGETSKELGQRAKHHGFLSTVGEFLSGSNHHRDTETHSSNQVRSAATTHEGAGGTPTLKDKLQALLNECNDSQVLRKKILELVRADSSKSITKTIGTDIDYESAWSPLDLKSIPDNTQALRDALNKSKASRDYSLQGESRKQYWNIDNVVDPKVAARAARRAHTMAKLQRLDALIEEAQKRTSIGV